MMGSKGLLIILYFIFEWFLVSAKYRYYHLSNVDICDLPVVRGGGAGAVSPEVVRRGRKTTSRNLSLGTGSSIIKLENPSKDIQPHNHNRAVKCKLCIKAPEGYGILVMVEKLSLRKTGGTSDQCLDYIQFGIDDLFPFITVQKSNRLCGELSGFPYDDPSGNLLIWINLGGRRATKNYPHISLVNFTLVVTAYRTKCKTPSSSELKCNYSDQCISNQYKCDGHINCAKDRGSPTDEENCQKSVFSTTENPQNNDTFSIWAGSPFNLIFLSIAGLLLILGAGVVVLFRKNKCCRSGRTRNCHLSEQQVFSLRELSGDRATSRIRAEENVYQPLAGNRRDGPPIVFADDGGPPPAYDDLFPDGWVPEGQEQHTGA